MAELFDSARDERERLVSPAGKCVGNTERGGNERSPEDDLPCAAQVVAPL
jgi:hypothetical protein